MQHARIRLALLIAGCGLALALIAGDASQRPPFNCSTDAECALMPDCLADPTCDGGPDTGR